MTNEELKLLLSTPIALFVMMLVASLASALIEVGKARKAGSNASFMEYLSHWPSTVGALLGNVIAFAVLVMTDQLNFAAALGIGYGVNNVVDMLPKNDRAAMLGVPNQSGFARIGMLITLAFVATFMLTACQTTPDDVVRPACETKSEYQVERCVKSVAETYEVYQQRGLELVQDPSTPEDVKSLIRKASALATPAVLEMLESAKAYMKIRDDLKAGKTTEEKLLIASQNAYAYVDIAEERINGLIAALSGRPSPGITADAPVAAPASASVSVR